MEWNGVPARFRDCAISKLRFKRSTDDCGGVDRLGKAMVYNMAGAADEYNGGLIECDLDFQERCLGRVAVFISMELFLAIGHRLIGSHLGLCCGVPAAKRNSPDINERIVGHRCPPFHVTLRASDGQLSAIDPTKLYHVMFGINAQRNSLSNIPEINCQPAVPCPPPVLRLIRFATKLQARILCAMCAEVSKETLLLIKTSGGQPNTVIRDPSNSCARQLWKDRRMSTSRAPVGSKTSSRSSSGRTESCGGK